MSTEVTSGAPSESSPRSYRSAIRYSVVVLALVLTLAFLVFIGGLAGIRFGRDALVDIERALTLRHRFEPVNVLLVGRDRTERGTTRADTIIVVRLDPFRRRTWLISIPRDTNVGLAGRARSAAPAARAALAQATAISPKRDHAADRVVASAAYNRQDPVSDHRWGNAYDLTDDPSNGIDCDRISERIRRSRDARVKYVIFNGRYFSSETGWSWRPYQGENPHRSHMHVSIREMERDDERDWPGIVFDVKRDIVDDALLAVRVRSKTHADTEHPDLEGFATRDAVKINSTYAHGGPALLIDAVERSLEIPVHHYVEVDFAGFTRVVDALGGVVVDVPEEIVDRKAANANPDGRASRVPSGKQRLDGEHALTFVRSRKLEDSDFGRTRNQQLFVKSFVRSFMSPRGLARAPLVAVTAGKHVRTDVGPYAAMKLIALSVIADPAHASAGTLYGRWRSPVVVTDAANRNDLLKTMLNGRRFMPAPPSISLTVLNGSGRAGQATMLARSLSRAGFDVEVVGNTRGGDYRGLNVFVPEEKVDMARRLQTFLPAARVSHSEDEHPLTTDVLVIIGRE